MKNIIQKLQRQGIQVEGTSINKKDLDKALIAIASTDYYPSGHIPYDEFLKDLKSDKIPGLKFVDKDGDGKKVCAVTDGKNFLHIDKGGDRFGIALTRYGGNDPHGIIEAISDHYGLHFMDESDIDDLYEEEDDDTTEHALASPRVRTLWKDEDHKSLDKAWKAAEINMEVNKVNDKYQYRLWKSPGYPDNSGMGTILYGYADSEKEGFEKAEEQFKKHDIKEMLNSRHVNPIYDPENTIKKATASDESSDADRLLDIIHKKIGMTDHVIEDNQKWMVVYIDAESEQKAKEVMPSIQGNWNREGNNSFKIVDWEVEHMDGEEDEYFITIDLGSN